MGEKKLEEPFMITLETATRLADNAVSTKTIQRAIARGELRAFKPGKMIVVIADDFKVWLKRFAQ